MGRRLTSAFELEVFDQSLSARRRLERYLSIYVQYYSPVHRTSTNELIHYLGSPLEGRRIIYFGLSFHGQPCGFCALMHYPEQSVGVFDFMVIAPTRRGHGAFFIFADLIAEFLESKRITPNYLVAEVVLSEAPLTHGITPQLLIRLMRFLRFKRAKIPYLAPDPSIVRHPEGCRAVLMISPLPDTDIITAAEFIRIVELIYLNHYLLWFQGVMEIEQAEAYENAVRTACLRLADVAERQQLIVLNGMRDLDVTLVPASEHRQLARIFVASTLALITIGVSLAQAPEITLAVFAVAAVILSLALLSHRVRRRLLRLFER